MPLSVNHGPEFSIPLLSPELGLQAHPEPAAPFRVVTSPHSWREPGRTAPEGRAGSRENLARWVPEPREPNSSRTWGKAAGVSGHARGCWTAQAHCWSRVDAGVGGFVGCPGCEEKAGEGAGG